MKQTATLSVFLLSLIPLIAICVTRALMSRAKKAALAAGIVLAWQSLLTFIRT